MNSKLTTNFEASGTTELISSLHIVQEQWLLMQGTNKDASCREPKSRTSGQEEKLQKIGSTRISRDQRDTLRILWNIVCKLVVLRFVQSVVLIPRFARFREDSELGTNNSQGARAASESFVTTSPNCAAE